MRKILNIKRLVKTILEEKPETRDDDNLLWLEALRAAVHDFKYGNKMVDLTLAYVLKSIHRLGLPSFETVSRVRRKLQQEYPELRGSENARRGRAEKQKKFEDFSRL